MDSNAREILERVRRFALPDNASGGRGTWLLQRGEMRLDPDRPWHPFRAEQRIDAKQLGFHWKARVRVAPLVWIRVTDAFEQGRGILEVRLRGLLLARAVGPETDQGELVRLLAELPWCPAALDHPALVWSAVDHWTLRVALEVRATRASLTMKVDDSGRVVSCQSERPRKVGKEFVTTDWVGQFGKYRSMGGMCVPTHGEVAWVLPEGAFTYWRGEILEAGIVDAQQTGNPVAPSVRSEHETAAH